jgi:drug/metabolite transporter (DMT)-like permease
MSIFSMFCNFSALARLAIVDATAISFAAPFFTVVFAALLLKERVHVYRWSGVIAGFIGILVMLAPYFDPALRAGTVTSSIGILLALSGAVSSAVSVIQTRRLTQTETTSSIVFYFSLICAIAGLLTWPFGWLVPTWSELAALVTIGLCGGVAHLFLTESYRLAPASLLAPFDYTSMIWVFLLGYFFFNEIPSGFVVVGAAIIATAGLFVMWREHQRGLQRIGTAKGPPTGT